MKWKIVPRNREVACIDVEDEGVALCCFAIGMDLDISRYFNAVPISDKEFEHLTKCGLRIE